MVGLRCAGAPLAMLLQRAGLAVVAIERDALFTDQPFSTHAIGPYGMRQLDRLGLGDAVRALAPRAFALRMQLEDEFVRVDLSDDGHDSRAPRRSKLDPLLQQSAIDAGVDVRPRTSVIGLLHDGESVVGVRVRDGAGEHELRAPIVVGADGRNSTIARLVEAPAYVEDTSPHGAYWAYFEETPLFSNDPRYDWQMCIHMKGDGARAVFQTDSGLLLMAGLAHREAIEPWRRDPDAALLDYLRSGALTGPLLEGSRQASPAIGMAGLRFFMKQPVGPGWALVGDAGLHLDPTPGLGISDAFRDAIELAEAIVDGSEPAFARYWRRRDADSIGLYRMAADMGSGNYNSPFNRMVFRRTQASAAMRERLRSVLDRECRTQEMLPLGRLAGWLLSEALHGRFSSFSGFGRTLQIALALGREQTRFDQELAAVEGKHRTVSRVEKQAPATAPPEARSLEPGAVR